MIHTYILQLTCLPRVRRVGETRLFWQYLIPTVFLALTLNIPKESSNMTKLS